MPRTPPKASAMTATTTTTHVSKWRPPSHARMYLTRQDLTFILIRAHPPSASALTFFIASFFSSPLWSSFPAPHVSLSRRQEARPSYLLLRRSRGLTPCESDFSTLRPKGEEYGRRPNQNARTRAEESV